MGRFIVKLENHYLEWSTITDSPVTFGVPLNVFKHYYRDEYGESSAAELERRLERVEKQGTSSRSGHTVEDLIAGNRAGPNEARLTLEEIIKAYCLQEPIRDGWLVPIIEID